MINLIPARNLAINRPIPFKNDDEKVDWVMERLTNAPTDAEDTGGTYPQGARFPAGLLTEVGRPPGIAGFPDPHPYPRHSWQMAENILARLQQDQDADLVPSDDAGLLHRVGVRRGGPPRPLTPRQELDQFNYIGLLNQLRQVNPRHPRLTGIQPEGWVPNERDLFELRSIVESEMRNAGQAAGFPRLERHHHLPRQFWELLPADTDPESAEYVSWLLRELHRLKPQGMHTGNDHWNAVWGKFLKDDYNRKKPKIDRELDRMIRNYLDRIAGPDDTDEE